MSPLGLPGTVLKNSSPLNLRRPHGPAFVCSVDSGHAGCMERCMPINCPKKEACSSFSNPLSASHSTQWRLVSLRCPHQFTVCWKVDFSLLYAKQCFFFEATQFSEKEIFRHKFSKLGQKTGFLGRVSFLKRGLFRHKYFKFSKLQQKTGFLGRVSPDSCLLATHLQSSVKKESSVKLKSG